jgi:hypothetical protein
MELITVMNCDILECVVDVLESSLLSIVGIERNRIKCAAASFVRIGNQKEKKEVKQIQENHPDRHTDQSQEETAHVSGGRVILGECQESIGKEV